MESKKMEITFLGNSEEYEDWDILAAIFLGKEEVEELAREFFVETIKHKVVNPHPKFSTNVIFWCEENSYDSWRKSLHPEEINPDYYTYGGFKISEKEFVSVTKEDSLKALQIIDRNKFLHFLEERRILVIRKNKDNEIF